MRHEIDLKPFITPNFVGVVGKEHTIPISELSAKTLDELCTQFRQEVFKKAGKPCTVTERVFAKVPKP